MSEKQNLNSFFEQLHWDALGRRLNIALKNPSQEVPVQINCPAVFDLAQQISSSIIASAINKYGEEVTAQDEYSYDEKVVILRILEAIICEYEDFLKKQQLSQLSPGVGGKAIEGKGS
jgi:hypothetical protein